MNLIDDIERQKLAVDRILPLHGRVVPLADLYGTASLTPKSPNLAARIPARAALYFTRA